MFCFSNLCIFHRQLAFLASREARSLSFRSISDCCCFFVPSFAVRWNTWLSHMASFWVVFHLPFLCLFWCLVSVEYVSCVRDLHCACRHLLGHKAVMIPWAHERQPTDLVGSSGWGCVKKTLEYQVGFLLNQQSEFQRFHTHERNSRLASLLFCCGILCCFSSFGP